MATYANYCERVYAKAGVQGTFAFPTSVSSLQNDVATSVRDAWVNLQTLRDWSFLRKNIPAFQTIEDQSIYTEDEVTLAYRNVRDLGHYPRHNSLYYNHRPLPYVEWESVPMIDDSVGQEPQWYSMDPGTKELRINKPNGIYSINLFYQRSPQIFTETGNENADIPVEFEDAIYYFALMWFSVTVGNNEIEDTYSVTLRDYLGRMQRKYVPKQRLSTRGGLI